jgi:Xaa-Pro aminopeptidase
VKKLGFEKISLSYGRFETIKKQLNKKISMIPTEGVVETLRIEKDDAELDKIRKAVAVTDKAFMNVLKLIRPKVTEKELAIEIDFQFRKYGDIAFPTIVAFGERGALPHAQPTDKKLRAGDSIVFDIGAKYQHYCADMTRTVVFGKASKKFRQVYEIVLTAQRLAEEKVRAGKKAVEIDGIARNYIKEKGYGEYFGHGLGHAVGIMVHEVPTLSSQSKDILQVNTTVTVEPGIYLPGEFGIRIEDLVLVKKTGCEILTKSPKELIEL